MIISIVPNAAVTDFLPFKITLHCNGLVTSDVQPDQSLKIAPAVAVADPPAFILASFADNYNPKDEVTLEHHDLLPR
ncbi:hypothetical protein CXB77_16745 [Chromatium okenii]|jgi:hypothetical protein|uniref:Uncharacterized protein n=1 Tax=Chromatium okenii TaxID=61644 RepID=A0A2S7XPN7_9GAMM|nr:hypothetical protein CXB77_16745 [Chromatium okenii]